MAILAIIVLIFINPAGSGCTDDGEVQPEIDELELASYWAPVWYQDTGDADSRADYITNFDFDSD